MPKRRNLWYALLLVFLGGFLLRQSFFIEGKSTAIIAMAIGIGFLISAMIVFWKNFRE